MYTCADGSRWFCSFRGLLKIPRKIPRKTRVEVDGHSLWVTSRQQHLEMQSTRNTTIPEINHKSYTIKWLPHFSPFFLWNLVECHIGCMQYIMNLCFVRNEHRETSSFIDFFCTWTSSPASTQIFFSVLAHSVKYTFPVFIRQRDFNNLLWFSFCFAEHHKKGHVVFP